MPSGFPRTRLVGNPGNELAVPILCTTMYYGSVVSSQKEHQKCVELTIACFQERGIHCEDNEARVGHDDAKRPDLILAGFETVLEVKTFQPKQQERQEAQRLGQELLSGKAVASLPREFFDRFGRDLSHSRKKFRECPDYHTAVVFYDLHSIFHEQNPEDLLLGEDIHRITTSGLVPAERKKRQLRQDKNKEIGAVVFHTGRNAFQIFHHHFAYPIRRINPGIFALSEDEHFEVIDDRVNPQIIPL
jgi:hypothetical protein